jgi:hypothetical protein
VSLKPSSQLEIIISRRMIEVRACRLNTFNVRQEIAQSENLCDLAAETAGIKYSLPLTGGE